MNSFNNDQQTDIPTNPTGDGCPTAQRPRRLKDRSLFLAPNDEVKILKKF